MKKIGIYILGLILSGVLLSPFAYIYFYPSNKAFWDAVMSNVMATGFALVAGIPIALLIDRKIKLSEGKSQYKSDRVREINLLRLIKEELNYSNNLFQQKKGNVATFTIQPLKSDLWDSLVTVQEVKFIENPQLLDQVINAYYFLKLVKDIEWKAYVAHRTSAIISTMQDGTQKKSCQMLIEDARRFDSVFESNITIALQKIDERLEKLKVYES